MSTAAKVLSPFFLFLLFSMCNCAVNWCDKLCFLHLFTLKPHVRIHPSTHQYSTTNVNPQQYKHIVQTRSRAWNEHVTLDLWVQITESTEIDNFYKQVLLTEIRLDWIGLCSVLRPHQHSIGYMGDGFYRSKDPTNSIKVLKRETEGQHWHSHTYK